MDRPTDRRSLSACSEPDCEEDEGSELEMLQGWMELSKKRETTAHTSWQSLAAAPTPAVLTGLPVWFLQIQLHAC